MRIALFTESLFRLSLQSAIDLAGDLGFSAIEVACKAPHFDLATARRNPEGIFQAIEHAGLDVAALSLYSNFTEPLQLAKQIEAAEFYVRLAPMFKTRTVKLTPGPPASASATSQHWGNLHRAIDQLAPVAEQLGVRLAFETHMRQLTDSLVGTRRLLQMVSSNAVGLTVDFSNLAFAGENMEDVIDALSSRMYHVHVKNGRIDEDGTWRFLSLNEGLTDYLPIFVRLRRLGYEGYLSLECLGPDARENPAATLKRDLDILTRLLKESDHVTPNVRTQ